MKSKEKLLRAAASGTHFAAALVRAAADGGGVIDLLSLARALVVELVAADEAGVPRHEAALLVARTLMATLAELPARPFAPRVRSHHLLGSDDVESFCYALAGKLADPTPGAARRGDDPFAIASARLVAELAAAAGAAASAPAPSAAPAPTAPADGALALGPVAGAVPAPAVPAPAPRAGPPVASARHLVLALLTYARGAAGLDLAAEHLIDELTAVTNAAEPAFVFDEECAAVVGSLAGLAAAIRGLGEAAGVVAAE